MPPAAYALVTLFLVCSVVAGIVAVRIAAAVAHGPTRRAAYVLPVLAGFGAFYLIGHRLGLAVAPEVSLFGFPVELFGDIAIGFAAALAAAVLQALVVRSRPGRTPADPTRASG